MFNDAFPWSYEGINRRIAKKIGDDKIKKFNIKTGSPSSVVNELLDLLVSRCHEDGFEKIHMQIDPSDSQAHLDKMTGLDQSVLERLVSKCGNLKGLSIQTL